MQSFLVVSTNQEARFLTAARKAGELLAVERGNLNQNPDFIHLEKEKRNSIGIDDVREACQRLSLKPFQSQLKVLLVSSAEFLTVEAQNALLKILEEPPGSSVIILACPSASLLLPTVVSRCFRLPVEAHAGCDAGLVLSETEAEELLKLLAAPWGDRLDFVERNQEIFSQREKAMDLIDGWIFFLHRFYLKPPLPNELSVKLRQFLTGILRVKREIATTNLSPRNLLEVILLS